jgi:murein hydrolase activator
MQLVKLNIFVYLLGWGYFGLAVADEQAVLQQRLAQLKQEIALVQEQMHNTRTEYGLLQRQLQISEENIGAVSRLLEDLHGELNNKQLQLQDLQQRQAKQQQQLNQHRDELATYVRSSYIIGNQDYIKLWLNQEDPFTIGRILGYYNYFQRIKAKHIEYINTALIEISTLGQDIAEQTQELNKLVNHETQRKTELEYTYNQRQAVLNSLEQQLISQDKKLKELEEDKRQLEQLLYRLGHLAAHIPSPKDVDFAATKGTLQLPVNGEILHKFGQKRVNHLKWQGLWLAAPTYSEVRAVAAGRVIFAEWFRNLGLLVILDHQNAYMSLYAHNQTLRVNTGDWVEAGMVIAQVGNSGGKEQSGLYFEIRHQGIPQNPIHWLQKL